MPSKKKKRIVKRTSLPLIETKRSEGLGGFLQHPVVPIILSAAVGGFGSDTPMTISGIAICTAVLVYDMWPLATRISGWIANRSSAYYQLGVWINSQKEVETKRVKVRSGWRSILFVLFCSVIMYCAGKLTDHVLEKDIATRQAAVFQQLRGTFSLPQNATLNDSKFTITNDSPFDLQLKTVACHLRYIRTYNQATGSGFTLEPFDGDIILHHGGDSQSENCPQDMLLRFSGNPAIYCADVGWRVQYSISGNPDEIETKQYRFVLHPNEHEWSGTPLDAVVPPCS